MGYALIDEEKLDMILAELRETRAIVVNLQPTNQEPDPHSEWTADMIANASGYHPETIKQKIRNAKIPKLRGKEVTIEYRYIERLKLKSFNPK